MIENILLGILFHFLGDYIFQNNWMANNKTSKNLPAFIHATIYSLPFILFLNINFYFWLIIYISHYLIDRYRLAVYWVKLVNWNWKSKNFGFKESVPMWLSCWLMIIIDNIFHICINTLCIYFSFK